ncbi:MAG: hypothetical protein ABSC47_13975 [Terracidiphilus sp.]|jgi:hypothetical protein
MLTFGFSTRHWQQVESGRPVTLTTVLRACDVFQIQPDELLKDLHVTQAPKDVNGPLVRRRKPHGTSTY